MADKSCLVSCPCFGDDCEALAARLRSALYDADLLAAADPALAQLLATLQAVEALAADLQIAFRKCDRHAAITDADELSVGLPAAELQAVAAQRHDIAADLIEAEWLLAQISSRLYCKYYWISSWIAQIRVKLLSAEQAAEQPVLDELMIADAMAAALVAAQAGPSADFWLKIQAFVDAARAAESFAAASRQDSTRADILKIEVLAAELQYMEDCCGDEERVLIEKIRSHLFDAELMADADLKAEILIAEAMADAIEAQIAAGASHADLLQPVRDLRVELYKVESASRDVEIAEIIECAQHALCELLADVKRDDRAKSALISALRDKTIAAEAALTLPDESDLKVLILSSAYIIAQLAHDCEPEKLVACLRQDLYDASLSADAHADFALKAILVEAQALALELRDELEREECHGDELFYETRQALESAEAAVASLSSSALMAAILDAEKALAEIRALVGCKKYDDALSAIAKLSADLQTDEALAQQLQELDAQAKLVQASIALTGYESAVEKLAYCR